MAHVANPAVFKKASWVDDGADNPSCAFRGMGCFDLTDPEVGRSCSVATPISLPAR
jgi:hypothetical protein